MGTTQVLTRDANGVTFADPAKPDFSVRFKTARGVKSLNGVNVENYATEIIMNDRHPVTLGSVTATDALSIRFRISGSKESMDRLEDCAVSIGAQIADWIAESVLLGFEPTTVPVNPVAT